MRVVIFILCVVTTLAAILGWMMAAYYHTKIEETIFRQKNLQDMCNDLTKENRELADMIHRLSSLSEDTNKIIGKCLEILIGLGCVESEQLKEINYYYVGDFNNLDKQKIWNFFKKFETKAMQSNTMWWSKYAADESHLSKAADHIDVNDACFLCFKGVAKND